MCRGAIQLDLRCPKRVDGIAADPDPDWSFDALVSELNALEMKLPTSFTVPFRTKTISRFYFLSLSYHCMFLYDYNSRCMVFPYDVNWIFLFCAIEFLLCCCLNFSFACLLCYLSSENEVERGRAFVLHAPEYEMEDTQSEDEHDKALVAGKRFNCDDLYLRCAHFDF